MDPYHAEGFRRISHENHYRLVSRNELYISQHFTNEKPAALRVPRHEYEKEKKAKRGRRTGETAG
jgi:hypothetical protein